MLQYHNERGASALAYAVGFHQLRAPAVAHVGAAVFVVVVIIGNAIIMLSIVLL